MYFLFILVENEKFNQDYQSKIRDLESEVSILRRSVPIWKDIDGNDLSEEVFFDFNKNLF